MGLTRRELKFADTGKPVPYCALCDANGEVLRVVPSGAYTPESVTDLLSFALIDVGHRAAFNTVGECSDGGFVVAIEFESPSIPDDRVNLCYWASFAPKLPSLYLYAGVVAPWRDHRVFIMHPGEALPIPPLDRERQLKSWASQVQAVWVESIMPWIAALVAPVSDYEAWGNAMIASSVSRKYITESAAAVASAIAINKNLWLPLAELSSAIDRLQPDPLRRLDLRRRANTQLKLLIRS